MALRARSGGSIPAARAARQQKASPKPCLRRGGPPAQAAMRLAITEILPSGFSLWSSSLG
jgi:hypothetical protein